MTEDVRQHQANPTRTADGTGSSGSGGAAAVTAANQAKQVDGDRFVLIRIEGMHCHRCEQAIKKTLQRKPGVHEVEVDFASGQASVLFNPSLITVDELIQGVKETGYKPVGFNQSQATDPVN
jgi:copper chaperone CopZ